MLEFNIIDVFLFTVFSRPLRCARSMLEEFPLVFAKELYNRQATTRREYIVEQVQKHIDQHFQVSDSLFISIARILLRLFAVAGSLGEYFFNL